MALFTSSFACFANHFRYNLPASDGRGAFCLHILFIAWRHFRQKADQNSPNQPVK